MRSVLAGPAALLTITILPACWAGREPSGTADVARTIDRPGLVLGVDVPDPRAADAALGGTTVSSDDVVAAVLATSPEVAELRARARAELAEVRAESALPPPELELESQHVPLARPWAYGEANMLMVGLRQELTLGGRRDALARAALADAEVAAAALTAREADLAGRARRAHAAWWLASREVALHDEHLELAHTMIEAIRASYRANRARAEDVARVELMVARLHTERTDAAARLDAARAMINALAGRDGGAALGSPAPPSPRLAAIAAPALASLQRRSRGEVRAAEAAARREAAQRDVARADRWPRVMVGVRYEWMPPAEHEDDAMAHGYGLMLSMTLPWLDRGRSGRVEAARQRELAERAGLAASDATLGYQLRAAVAELGAARARLASLRDDQLPRAERLYEATRSSFSTGAGDASAVLAALEGWQSLRIAVERAVADVAMAEAEVERAVGAPLPRTEGGAP